MFDKFCAYNKSFWSLFRGIHLFLILDPYLVLKNITFLRQFCCPTFKLSEGLPMALIESLGLVTPIIASHQCNIDKIEMYESGFLLNRECTNLPSVLLAISRLTPSQYMHFVSGAMSHFDHEFSPSSVSQGYMNLYSSAFSSIPS